MSLGIVVKGSEGIVLAADSRITLFVQVQPGPGRPPITALANFDNATKLLRVKNLTHVGAVTYGIGAMMTANGPRTMQSFVPTLEADVRSAAIQFRVPVKEFAEILSKFYSDQWSQLHSGPRNPGENIEFLVGGYDENAPYGRVFRFAVPERPVPEELNAGPGEFGMTWGGQSEVVQRIMNGHDAGLGAFLQQELGLSAAQADDLSLKAARRFVAPIPFQFLPLQDCIDVATFLIQGTVDLQRFAVGIRGVGGQVEVATITPTEGFTWVAQKKISLSRV